MLQSKNLYKLKNRIHKPQALIRGTRQLQEPLKVEFRLVLV